MNTNGWPLTQAEYEAVAFQAEYEVAKIAADKRGVSFHTQKNQLKSAMAKLGVGTQIALLKEFFAHLYGIRYCLTETSRAISTCLLVLFLSTLGQTDEFSRIRRTSRRSAGVCRVSARRSDNGNNILDFVA